MKHFLRVIVMVALWACFSAPQSIFAQSDTSAGTLNIGDTLNGQPPAAGNTTSYTLNVQPGEIFTITLKPQDASAANWWPDYEVDDTDGNPVNGWGFSSQQVFDASDKVPYTLKINSVDSPYMVSLAKGDTLRVERGTIAFDSKVSGDVAETNYDGYTLDAQEGQSITIHSSSVGNKWFILHLYDSQHTIWHEIHAAVSTETTGDAVYTLRGQPPYDLQISSNQEVNYSLSIDDGDTLPRRQLGTLAPGQVVQGETPSNDGTFYFYA
ncbi:MAG: hypothetical protein ABI700_15700, partial [Chloroflexota bacterium]